MNPTLDLLAAHRSIRAFRPDPVPDAHLRLAVERAQCAATSSHVQAYSLLDVTDPAEREALVELTGGQPYVRDCGRFLVVCADTRRHRLVARRADVECVQNLETFLLGVVDASLFAQNLCVALESLGYGICYIGGLRNELPTVVERLAIPTGVWPLYGLCVGVPDQDPETKPRLPVDAVLHPGRYRSDAELERLIDAHDAEMRAYYGRRGKPHRDWSGGLARRFKQPVREHLRGLFERLGASFE